MSTGRNNAKITSQPSGGGNKKQGLAPKATFYFKAPFTGRQYSTNSGDGKKRNEIFCMNMLGGIGRYRSQFNPSADGINCKSEYGLFISFKNLGPAINYNKYAGHPATLSEYFKPPFAPRPLDCSNNFPTIHDYELWEINAVLKLPENKKNTTINCVYSKFKLPHCSMDGLLTKGLSQFNTNWNWDCTYAPHAALLPSDPSYAEFFAINTGNGTPISTKISTISSYMAPIGSLPPQNMYIIGSTSYTSDLINILKHNGSIGNKGGGGPIIEPSTNPLVKNAPTYIKNLPETYIGQLRV